MNKTLIAKVVLFTCASLLSSLAQARYYDDVIDSGYIRIGVYRDFPPYSFMQNGEPAGIDVEVGKAIAKELGVDFRVHWMIPDENLEDDLRNNVWKGHYLDKNEENPLALKNIADVMMRVPYDRDYSYKIDGYGLALNDMVVMFGPYHRESWQVAYDSTKLDNVSTVAVFQYHPIGVEIDSLPSMYLTSAFGGRMRDKTHHYPNAEAAFTGMLAEEVDAVMAMRSEVDWLIQKSDLNRYKLGENSYPMMGKQKWDIGMAVKHTYRQLGYAVGDVVEKMIKDGEMEQIFSKHGLRYELPGLYQEMNQ
ncbi:MAG: transporter substrate-binding domain-containing protein [Neptuniibacter sp.]